MDQCVRLVHMEPAVLDVEVLKAERFVFGLVLLWHDDHLARWKIVAFLLCVRFLHKS